jgi:hypothetical protein
MDITKTVRVYVSLPTDADPTPAFVLHSLADAATFVRIERTANGPGRAAIVGEKPSYLERTELGYAILGMITLSAGKFDFFFFFASKNLC